MALIPPEIVEQFMWHINEDKDRTEPLLACSLVSHTWGSIARPFLYNNVFLDISRSQATTLIDIISKSSQIQAYIHHLLIGRTSNPPASPLSILSKLGSLPSLQSLQIRSSVRLSLHLDRGFAMNLGSVLGSKSLTSLELSGFNFPAELLYHCVALQNLAIRQVTFMSPSTSDIDQELHVPHLLAERRPILKSLILSTFHREGNENLNWLLSPLSPFDLSQLETFIGVDRGNMMSSYEAHCRLISHASHSLKTVLIDPPTSCITGDVQNPLGLLDPRKLQNISSITVAVTQTLSQFNALPWLVLLLSGLPNPETLHELVLLCDLYKNTAGGFSAHSERWSDMDNLLNRFCNLQRLHLKCYDEPDDEVSQAMISWFHEMLPTWASKGVLSVECFHDVTYTTSIHQRLMGSGRYGVFWF
ncbi:hypothetical protein BDN72DRAFT_850194 [Pluteus cervinus]|uniref:Uncharacterized protein n=1 Tax=Pluteus cervinus TaxID=181527 RepID=A0ACD3A5L1_9AGAR|nr:hypothetical protein BDN72DRAFT_850194 [Pluteus cervinus]